MKSITTSSDCLACHTCCIFENDETDYAPLLSASEYRKILFNHPEYRNNFKNVTADKSVYQIILVKSADQKRLVCPFYNEKTYMCAIYPKRPLDCQLWPVMVTRTGTDNLYDIVLAARDECPVLEKAPEDAIRKYQLIIVKQLNSEKYRIIYRNHPELALEYGEWMEKIGILDAR